MHQDGGRFRSLVGDAGLGSVLRGRRGAMGLRVERNPLNVGGHSFCWTRRDSAGGSAVFHGLTGVRTRFLFAVRGR